MQYARILLQFQHRLPSVMYRKQRILLKILKWKSVQWELSWSMRTDGQTDGRTGRYGEASCGFSYNFLKAPKSCPSYSWGATRYMCPKTAAGPQTYFRWRLLVRRLLVAHRCLTWRHTYICGIPDNRGKLCFLWVHNAA